MAFIMRGMDFGGIKSSPNKSNGYRDSVRRYRKTKRDLLGKARGGTDSTGGDASWSRKEIRRERKRRIRLSKQGPKYLEDGTKNPNWGMYGGEKARKYGRGESGKRLQQKKKSYIKNIKKMRKPQKVGPGYVSTLNLPQSGIPTERLRPKGGIYKAGVDYVIDPIKKIPGWISKWAGGGGGPGGDWLAKLKGGYLSGGIKEW